MFDVFKTNSEFLKPGFRHTQLGVDPFMGQIYSSENLQFRELQVKFVTKNFWIGNRKITIEGNGYAWNGFFQKPLFELFL